MKLLFVSADAVELSYHLADFGCLSLDVGCTTLGVGMWRHLAEIRKAEMYHPKDFGMAWMQVNSLKKDFIQPCTYLLLPIEL